MADVLVAEAELVRPAFDLALERLLARVGPSEAVRTLLDLGAGPGVGTERLAHAFPAATLVAVDLSPELLEVAAHRAEASGVGDRLRTEVRTLGEPLDDLGPAQVAWASMVLHHVDDIAATLATIRHALAPGGAVVVTEFGDPLTILPADHHLALDGTWDRWARITEASLTAHLGTDVRTIDWAARLEAAGFTAVEALDGVIDRPGPLPDTTRQVLALRLRDELAALGGELHPADRDSLLELADAVEAGSVRLHLHTSRRLVLATRRPPTDPRRTGSSSGHPATDSAPSSLGSRSAVGG